MITLANTDELDFNQFATDASALQLRPGYFPDMLRTDLGDCSPFRAMTTNMSKGEITSVDYSQNDTVFLSVFNT